MGTGMTTAPPFSKARPGTARAAIERGSPPEGKQPCAHGSPENRRLHGSAMSLAQPSTSRIRLRKGVKKTTPPPPDYLRSSPRIAPVTANGNRTPKRGNSSAKIGYLWKFKKIGRRLQRRFSTRWPPRLRWRRFRAKTPQIPGIAAEHGHTPRRWTGCGLIALWQTGTLWGTMGGPQREWGHSHDKKMAGLPGEQSVS